MNIRRFTAPTAREALAKARMAFGDGTLILSNRQTPDGVEVMATAEETLQDMDAGMQTSSPLQKALERRAADEGMGLRKDRLQAAPQRSDGLMSTLEHVQARQNAKEEQAREMQARPVKPINELAQHSVQDDVEQLSMSTLTFQDYVRERMLRRRHESSLDSGEALPTFAQRVQDRNNERGHERPMAAKAQPASAGVARHNPLRPEQIQIREGAAKPQAVAQAAPQNFMQEMQSMKDLIEERFNTLTWLCQTRQNPIQSS